MTPREPISPADNQPPWSHDFNRSPTETEQLSPTAHFVIEPSKKRVAIDFRVLWRYRELLYFLIWRDVKVRYKQTILGIIWVILQPLLLMIVFTIFFGYFGGFPSDGVPYPIFTYVALLPWQLFANSLNLAGTSLVMNQELIAKVYFPRLLVPLAAVFVGVVDFCVAFVVLVGLMFFYGIQPSMTMLALPLLVVLAILTAFALSLWLSALNVRYRDVQYAIPFLIQLGLFATPIAYASSIVPEKWRYLYQLNPMVGVVDGFRWAILGQATEVGASLIVATILVFVILITGLIYFRKMEQTFADVI